MEKRITQIQVYGMFSTETELVTNYPVKEQLEQFLSQLEDVNDVIIAGYMVSESDEGEPQVKAMLILKDRNSTTISLIPIIPKHDPSKPATIAIDLEGIYIEKTEAEEQFGDYVKCARKAIEDEDHTVLGYLVDYRTSFPQIRLDAIIAVKLETVKSTIIRVVSVVPPSREVEEACKL